MPSGVYERTAKHHEMYKKLGARRRGSNNPFSGKSSAGELNGRWLGDAINQKSVHVWLRHWSEKSQLCEGCDFKPTDSNKLQFANRSLEYRRDPADYLHLCVNCHRFFDSKYTFEDILMIRESLPSAVFELSKQFNVSHGTISNIRRRRSYDLPDGVLMKLSAFKYTDRENDRRDPVEIVRDIKLQLIGAAGRTLYGS